ncbi:MAG: hypothetical protein F9K27_09850 [Anaerolineae bacterium]|nr:MAG: hypothetical protein F9K27_09850 [Anaerolineae bacterium]
MVKKFIPLLLLLCILPMLASAQGVPELPEIYTSQDGSFQFNFPKNWWLEVGPSYIIIATSETALDAAPDALKDGEGRAIFLSYTPDQIEGFEGDVNAENIAAALGSRFSEENPVSDPEAMDIAIEDSAQVRWETNDGEITLMAVNVFDETYIVALVIAAQGELDKIEPTIAAIAETFNYRTVEEIEADNQALLDRWNASIRTLEDGTSYYFLVPEGEAPDAGWPVVVALADFRQDAAELLPHFAELADRRGIVLVASGFGDYADGETNRALLDEILGVINDELEVMEKGVVLYGFGEGGAFVTDYLEVDTEGVAGIVAEGPRIFYLPPADRQEVPYGVIYGERDPNLSSLNMMAIDETRAMGYAVRVSTIQNGLHEISVEGVSMVFDMIDLLQSVEE